MTPSVHFKNLFIPTPVNKLGEVPEDKTTHETAGPFDRGSFRQCKLTVSAAQKNNAFALVTLLGAKSRTLFLIARQSFFNDRDRGVSRTDIIHLDLLAFELLVVLEKALQDEQAMRRQFVGLDVAVEFGIVGGYGDNFVVAGAGIDHGHQANGARFDERERLDRL